MELVALETSAGYDIEVVTEVDEVVGQTRCRSDGLNVAQCDPKAGDNKTMTSACTIY